MVRLEDGHGNPVSRSNVAITVSISSGGESERQHDGHHQCQRRRSVHEPGDFWIGRPTNSPVQRYRSAGCRVSAGRPEIGASRCHRTPRRKRAVGSGGYDRRDPAFGRSPMRAAIRWRVHGRVRRGDGGGSVTGANAVSGPSGFATVGGWRLGPAKGAIPLPLPRRGCQAHR